jgi:hypothetical protein
MPRSALFAILASVALSCATPHVAGQEATQRTWTDSSGTFEVRATLIEQTESTAQLHTADGRKITVPIERLSQSDQGYLKSLNAPPDNPFAGGTPVPAGAEFAVATLEGPLPKSLRASPASTSVGVEMALPGTGTTVDLTTDPSDRPFVPDPQPDAPSIPAAVVPVSAVDAYDKVAPPVLVDAAEGRFFVSIGRNKSGSPEETRGRIYSVNLAAKQSDLVWDFPNAVRVWDHDTSSGQTLIVDKLDQFQRGGELVMVLGLEEGNAKPLYRRTLPGAGKPGFAPQVEWARLLSASHVAVIVDRVLYVWDLPAAKLVYRIEDVYASEPPVFSGNQLYMAVPQGGRVVIVETATGEVRKSIATGSTLKPGVAFHPNGRLLAICFSNRYLVWDCVADSAVSEATTTVHLSSHPIHWIGPKMFRGAMGDVVQLDLGMAAWKYYVAVSTKPFVLGDKLLTATTSQNCSLVSVQVPHESAERTVDQLIHDGDAAMLVRAGSPVAIAVEAAVQVDQAEIKASLSEAAEKAGWKVSQRAPVTLVAKIGRGETQELRFRSLGGGTRTVSTANLTPFTAQLEIRGGSEVLWSRSTENRVPSMLRLQEGETVQDAVNRFEKPDAAFFSRLNLPPRIPKPEVSKQVGMSSLKDGKWQDLKVSGSSSRL